MGAPTGNTNAVKHGGRSNRHGLAVAKLGKRMAGAYIDAARLRRAIERAVKEKHGGPSLLQLAKIQTLIRHELSCRASETALRDTPDMPPDQVRQHREYICRWSRERDKLLSELLGDVPSDSGDGGQDDPWSVVDERIAERTRIAQQASSMAGGTSCDQDNSNATGDVLGGSNVESETADGASGDESGQSPAVPGHAPGSENLGGGVV